MLRSIAFQGPHLTGMGILLTALHSNKMEGIKYVKYMQITYILPSIQLKCGILNGGTTIFYKIVEKANCKCISTMMVSVLHGYEVKSQRLSM